MQKVKGQKTIGCDRYAGIMNSSVLCGSSQLKVLELCNRKFENQKV